MVKVDDCRIFPIDPFNFIFELDGVCRPEESAQAHAATVQVANIADFEQWHNCLGHASQARIQAVFKDEVQLGKTVTCKAGKLTHLPYNSQFKPATEALQVVHGNLVGPISPATKGEGRYFLTMANQYSGHISTTVLKLKSDALVAYFERQTGWKIKKLITNGGGKFVKKVLSEVLTIKGIVFPPYMPQPMALRTIINMTCTLMMQANLAPEWWGKAVTVATATTNCLPSLSKSRKQTVELDTFSPWSTNTSAT
jgi:hypothetical protein